LVWTGAKVSQHAECIAYIFGGVTLILLRSTTVYWLIPLISGRSSFTLFL